MVQPFSDLKKGKDPATIPAIPAIGMVYCLGRRLGPSGCKAHMVIAVLKTMAKKNVLDSFLVGGFSPPL